MDVESGGRKNRKHEGWGTQAKIPAVTTCLERPVKRKARGDGVEGVLDYIVTEQSQYGKIICRKERFRLPMPG